MGWLQVKYPEKFGIKVDPSNVHENKSGEAA